MVMRTSTSQEVKETLVEILDHLSSVQRRQVLDSARFLRQQAVEEAPLSGQRIQLNLVPAASLADLTGLVSLGGDAVADTDALYDGNGCS
jgi:hypothetical protein